MQKVYKITGILGAQYASLNLNSEYLYYSNSQIHQIYDQ